MRREANPESQRRRFPAKLLPAPATQNRVLSWVPPFMLGLIVAGFAVWLMLRGGPTPPKPVKKFAVTLPANGELSLPGADSNALASGVAISPDGGQLVYVASDGKSRRLYLRKMEEFDATPLAGTDGAGYPFFSPDGQWVGFYADGKLKKVLLTGGKPIDICEVGTAFILQRLWSAKPYHITKSSRRLVKAAWVWCIKPRTTLN